MQVHYLSLRSTPFNRLHFLADGTPRSAKEPLRKEHKPTTAIVAATSDGACQINVVRKISPWPNP
jgi:hypothetical protein